MGSVRPIILRGAPVLHRPCAHVTRFDDALSELVEDMIASMRAAGGVGLAANQIGVDARVLVIDCLDLETGQRTFGHVVNPVLDLPGPRELLVRAEACLSVPGVGAELSRAASAVVTGVDVTGAPVEIAGHNLVSRCLQHEVDHLDGTLYLDRLPAKARRAVLSGVQG